MQHDLHSDLSSLDLDERNYRALLTMPAIYVAWADRTLTHAERASVLEIARERLGLTEAELAPVRRWLERPPSPLEYRKAFQVLLGLAATPDEPLVDASQFPKLMTFAELVATRAAAALGQPLTVRPTERDALAELESVLRVGTGRPWVDVVREVGVDANLLSSPTGQTAQRATAERAPLRRYRAAVRASQVDTGPPEPDGGIV